MNDQMLATLVRMRARQDLYPSHWSKTAITAARDSDGTRSAETACPAPVPQDCQARAESIAQKDNAHE